MISMGMVLQAIPSIRIDMREGMVKLVTHLIEEHGRRKIAFIRGPEVSQDAQERYQAYREAVAEFGLPANPHLVQPGDFGRNSGKVAVQKLAEVQRINFDALVAANDNMAIGALQALQARGIRVPDDVIVTGFDDIEETGALTPTLTTVRTPWHSLGSQSVDLLLARITGDPMPEQIYLQTRLISRQSCGCQPTSAKKHTEPGLALHSTDLAHDPIRICPGPLLADFTADVRSQEEGLQRFIPAWVEALSRLLQRPDRRAAGSLDAFDIILSAFSKPSVRSSKPTPCLRRVMPLLVKWPTAGSLFNGSRPKIRQGA